jgi:hypothetical protein
MVVPVVTAVLDEQIEETGTIAGEESPVLDAEASQVEPMQPMVAVSPKDKAKAPWGYKGRNINPPKPSTNSIELRMMAFRIKTVLPKTTKQRRQTWSALCKKLDVTGHTTLKDATPENKALWLSEKGITFEKIVRASLELAAS